MIRLKAAVLAALLMMSTVVADRADAQRLIATPGTSGDQLLFFYDATAGRVPFLVVSSFSNTAVTLEIAWYSQDLTQRLATQFQVLVPGANVILDPSQVQGVNGNAGLTVVTPVVSAADARPVVPTGLPGALPSTSSGPLFGGFTLADLSSKSAFGQNPLARVAVDADGNHPMSGAIVDGTTIRYQRIGPDALVLPFYFNPNGGTPLANRAFFAAFEDRYANGGFSIGPVELTLFFSLLDSTGTIVAQRPLNDVSGVVFTDVQSLAGNTPLARSGKGFFSSQVVPLQDNANLLGLMSQSLDTFAVGQVMPGYFLDLAVGNAGAARLK